MKRGLNAVHYNRKIGWIWGVFWLCQAGFGNVSDVPRPKNCGQALAGKAPWEASTGEVWASPVAYATAGLPTNVPDWKVGAKLVFHDGPFALLEAPGGKFIVTRDGELPAFIEGEGLSLTRDPLVLGDHVLFFFRDGEGSFKTVVSWDGELISITGEPILESLPNEAGWLLSSIGGNSVLVFHRRQPVEGYLLGAYSFGMSPIDIESVDSEWGQQYGLPLSALYYRYQDDKRVAILDHSGRLRDAAFPGPPYLSFEPVGTFGLGQEEDFQVVPLSWGEQKGLVLFSRRSRKAGEAAVHEMTRYVQGEPSFKQWVNLPDLPGALSVPTTMESLAFGSQVTLLGSPDETDTVIVLPGGASLDSVEDLMAKGEGPVSYAIAAKRLPTDDPTLVVMASGEKSVRSYTGKVGAFSTLVLSTERVGTTSPKQTRLISKWKAVAVQTTFEGVAQDVPLCAIRFHDESVRWSSHVLLDRLTGETLHLNGKYTFHPIESEGGTKYVIVERLEYSPNERLSMALYDPMEGRFFYVVGSIETEFPGEASAPRVVGSIVGGSPIHVQNDPEMELVRVNFTGAGGRSPGNFILFPAVPDEETPMVMGEGAYSLTVSTADSGDRKTLLFAADKFRSLSTGIRSSEASKTETKKEWNELKGRVHSTLRDARTQFLSVAKTGGGLELNVAHVSGVRFSSAEISENGNQVHAKGEASLQLGGKMPVELIWRIDDDVLELIPNRRSDILLSGSEGNLEIQGTDPTPTEPPKLVVRDPSGNTGYEGEFVVDLWSDSSPVEGQDEHFEWLKRWIQPKSIGKIEKIERVEEGSDDLILVHTRGQERAITFVYSREWNRCITAIPSYSGCYRVGSHWVIYGQPGAGDLHPSLLVMFDSDFHQVVANFDLGNQSLASNDGNLVFDPELGQIRLQLESEHWSIFDTKDKTFLGLLPEELRKEVDAAASSQHEFDPPFLVDSLNDRLFLQRPMPIYPGREPVLSSLMRSLSLERRRTLGDNKNVLLVGDPGTGTTNLIHNMVATYLGGRDRGRLNVDFIELEPSDFVGGTGLRGSLDKRFTRILGRAKILKRSGVRLVVILNNLSDLRSNKTGEDPVVGMQRLMKSPDLDFIGVTGEWGKRYLEKLYPTLMELFTEQIPLKPMDQNETLGVVRSHLAERFKDKAVPITSSQLEEAVRLSFDASKGARIRSPGRELSLVDRLLEEMGEASFSRAALSRAQARLTGLPAFLFQTDMEAYQSEFEARRKKLRDRVRFQTQPIDQVMSAVNRYAMGMKADDGPIFMGILIGPTGVGKTSLSVAMAKDFYGDEDALIQVNCAELEPVQSVVQRLEAQLKSRPGSIILFDEFEKATPELKHVLLGIKNGQIGEASTAHSLVFVTTNLGAKAYKAKMGRLDQEAPTVNEANVEVEEALRKELPPELVARFERLYFNALTEAQVRAIVVAHLEEMDDSVAKRQPRNLQLTFGNSVVKYLTERFTQKEDGMRGVSMLIEQDLVTFLAGAKAAGRLKPEHSYTILRTNGGYTIRAKR